MYHFSNSNFYSHQFFVGANNCESGAWINKTKCDRAKLFCPLKKLKLAKICNRKMAYSPLSKRVGLCYSYGYKVFVSTESSY